MSALLEILDATRLRERSPGLMAAAEGILAYAGTDKRAGELYGSANILLKARNLVKGLQVSSVWYAHKQWGLSSSSGVHLGSAAARGRRVPG